MLVSLGHVSRSGIAGTANASGFNILRKCQTFSRDPALFYNLTWNYKASSFSTSLPVLVCHFDCKHSSGCAVVSQCGFDFHYPDA